MSNRWLQGQRGDTGHDQGSQFGPMMMFGLGGIFVEVMKDVAFNLAPITKEEAMQMLVTTRSYELLKGIRGQAAVDIDAIGNKSAVYKSAGNGFSTDSGNGYQSFHGRHCRKSIRCSRCKNNAFRKLGE